MKNYHDEMALWNILLDFENLFLYDFSVLESNFEQISRENASRFILEADRIANYIRFFSCFQQSAIFTCRDEAKIPPNVCIFGIDDLVIRSVNKLTAFLGEKLTFETDMTDFQPKLDAIFSSFYSIFDYRFLKYTINLPENRLVLKVLNRIPVYKKLLQNDGNLSIISTDFLNDKENLKFEDSEDTNDLNTELRIWKELLENFDSFSILIDEIQQCVKQFSGRPVPNIWPKMIDLSHFIIEFLAFSEDDKFSCISAPRGTCKYGLKTLARDYFFALHIFFRVVQRSVLFENDYDDSRINALKKLFRYNQLKNVIENDYLEPNLETSDVTSSTQIIQDSSFFLAKDVLFC